MDASSSEGEAAEGSAEEMEAEGAGGGSAGAEVGSGAGWRSTEKVDVTVAGAEVEAEVGVRVSEGDDPLNAGCDVCDCGSRGAASLIWTPPSSFAWCSPRSECPSSRPLRRWS